MLNDGLKGIAALEIFTPPSHIYHPYYKYYVKLKPETLKPNWSRQRIMEEINREGVVCQTGSTWGIGLEDAWENAESIDGKYYNLKLKEHLPNDYDWGKNALMFQVHPTLTDEHIECTIQTVSKVLEEAQK